MNPETNLAQLSKLHANRAYVDQGSGGVNTGRPALPTPGLTPSCGPFGYFFAESPMKASIASPATECAASSSPSLQRYSSLARRLAATAICAQLVLSSRILRNSASKDSESFLSVSAITPAGYRSAPSPVKPPEYRLTE